LVGLFVWQMMPIVLPYQKPPMAQGPEHDQSLE
jgi:hypothetical protein